MFDHASILSIFSPMSHVHALAREWSESSIVCTSVAMIEQDPQFSDRVLEFMSQCIRLDYRPSLPLRFRSQTQVHSQTTGRVAPTGSIQVHESPCNCSHAQTCSTMLHYAPFDDVLTHSIVSQVQLSSSSTHWLALVIQS